ncbi:FecCD family ABC transporter permease [Blastochloris sulfoviridis]|uniref:Iron ABC transporter permease n=1 Tax=Blastochloris sulfoviridis TaxID=50712 RepID=A0A5M6I1D0_9HYPH|nr:iron ABC transporter permease [Blastochloris sulfoviridis]KAA5601976.1 iron ABC transporter permease [Blastochloris sulfoviridis]
MTMALPAAAGAERPHHPLAHAPALVLGILLALLIAAALSAATVGAAGIPLERLPAALGFVAGDPATVERDRLVVWSIRLPRIAMAVMVGALLAAGGTILQGLFRNPLADPGLVGVSSGAALAAAATIVLGDRLMPALPAEALPVAAFAGALIVTATLYRIATNGGRTSIAMLLLGGLAIGALAGALTGLLVFIADDRQLRDVTFWTLGSLSGATWAKAATILPFLLALVIATPLLVRDLDRLALGEAEAFHLGTSVERLKRVAIVLVSAAVGAAVAVSGVIGFVGIIVPHLLRLIIGPGHRLLVPAALLLGPVLMLGADTLARVVVAPAELPIGILTAILGAPVFLGLLLRQRAQIGL